MDRKRRESTPKDLSHLLKRRAAIEPPIRHLKSEHRLDRKYRKGTVGNAVNALLSAPSVNF